MNVPASDRVVTRSDNLSAFDLVEIEIADLYGEARQWLDGEPIKSQAESDALATLVDLLRKAETKAEALRQEEVRPHDEAKAAVQARYYPLIGNTKSIKGKTVSALAACKAAQTVWLAKLDAEKRAAAEAARMEADALAAAAQAAIRAADVTNLAAREDAERMLRDASAAERAAIRAENDKAQAKGGARAMSLRTSYRAEIHDPTAFARFVWANHQDELRALLVPIADRLINAGQRSIPGVTVHEDRRAA